MKVWGVIGLAIGALIVGLLYLDVRTGAQPFLRKLWIESSTGAHCSQGFYFGSPSGATEYEKAISQNLNMAYGLYYSAIYSEKGCELQVSVKRPSNSGSVRYNIKVSGNKGSLIINEGTEDIRVGHLLVLHKAVAKFIHNTYGYKISPAQAKSIEKKGCSECYFGSWNPKSALELQATLVESKDVSGCANLDIRPVGNLGVDLPIDFDKMACIIVKRTIPGGYVFDLKSDPNIAIYAIKTSPNEAMAYHEKVLSLGVEDCFRDHDTCMIQFDVNTKTLSGHPASLAEPSKGKIVSIQSYNVAIYDGSDFHLTGDAGANDGYSYPSFYTVSKH